MKRLNTYFYLLAILIVVPCNVQGQIEVHDFGQVSIGGRPVNRYYAHTHVNGPAAGHAFIVKHNNMNPYSYGIGTILVHPQNTSYNLMLNNLSTFYVNGIGTPWSRFPPNF